MTSEDPQRLLQPWRQAFVAQGNIGEIEEYTFGATAERQMNALPLSGGLRSIAANPNGAGRRCITTRALGDKKCHLRMVSRWT